ncbi:MAG: hypothetical protein ACP5L3_05960 [Caldisericum sp.]
MTSGLKYEVSANSTTIEVNLYVLFEGIKMCLTLQWIKAYEEFLQL